MLKRIFQLLTIVFFLFSSIEIFAQSVIQKMYQTAIKEQVTFYHHKQNHIWFPMEFGKSSLDSISTWIDSLRTENFAITEVDVVYSDYPKEHNFHKLNLIRLSRIKQLLPKKFDNDSIVYRLVRQTNCNTINEARALSHGISIRYEIISQKEKITEKDITTTRIQSALENQPKVQISETEIGKDLTSLKVLNRRGASWKGEWVIITDLTYL